MFAMAELILTAIIALVAGLLIGFTLSRSIAPSAREGQGLKSKLDEAEDQLKEYQQEVTRHFSETSELINRLTQSYKDVHEHLADGALQLATADVSKKLIDAGDGNLSIGKEDIPAPEAPKDWAPKSGQLSEDFGLSHPQKESQTTTNNA